MADKSKCTIQVGAELHRMVKITAASMKISVQKAAGEALGLWLAEHKLEMLHAPKAPKGIR
jgi:dsDNA-binding SOS-regulon protein